MVSISEAFKKCRNENRKALIPYLTAGFPDDRMFIKLVKALTEAGADAVEIGIPFSDPLADGKTIQYSSQKALENGVTVAKVFEYISELDGRFEIPLIIMSYFNPIHFVGVEEFIEQAHELGVQGLIIPDLIPEEGRALERVCRRNEVDLIYFLAPTTSLDRRKLIVNRSRGFVYLVTVSGVTGARKALPQGLNNWIGKVKKSCSLPVCAGFGISNLQQVRSVSRAADGVIVGSALIDIIRKAPSSKMILKETTNFIKHLRKGLKHG